jgi:hypothetical protein
MCLIASHPANDGMFAKGQDEETIDDTIGD